MIEKKNILPLLFFILLLSGLYLTSLHNYLLFHSIAELFSVVIAIGIFMLAWNSRQFLDNSNLLFLGIAYLFIGTLDAFHMFAYAGMGIFEGYKANLPTQLWIGARYMESLSLLIAFLFFEKRLKANLIIFIYAAVISFLLGSIFYWGVFPACFVDGEGLTAFKKMSEYIISLIFAGAIGLLFKKRKKIDQDVFRLLVASIIIKIFSELAFTFYIHVYGLSNLVGHYFKIVSFVLIYRALIVTGLTKPYNLMFRELKQAEKKLRYQATLLENVSDAVVSVDMDYRVISWNEAAEQIYGFKAAEAVGKLYRELTKIEFFYDSREDLLFKLGRDSFWRGEVVQHRKDGARIIIQSTISLIKNKEGNTIGYVGVNQDITVRKQSEETLLLSQKNASMLSRKLFSAQENERARLARELHDDISQRLAYLKIEVDKLEMKKEPFPTPVREILRHIGQGIGELSSDINMISRRLHPITLGILGLIRSVETECRNFTRMKTIPVTFDLDDKLDKLSKEISLCIYRILQEGLRNIGRHANATEVHVTLFQKADILHLLIKDNGIGFDSHSNPKITGLGIASMTERTRLIHGDLSVESQLGIGTFIKLAVPLKLQDED